VGICTLSNAISFVFFGDNCSQNFLVLYCVWHFNSTVVIFLCQKLVVSCKLDLCKLCLLLQYMMAQPQHVAFVRRQVRKVGASCFPVFIVFS